MSYKVDIWEKIAEREAAKAAVPVPGPAEGSPRPGSVPAGEPDWEGLIRRVEDVLAKDYGDLYQKSLFDPKVTEAFIHAVGKIVDSLDPPLQGMVRQALKEKVVAKSVGIGKLEPLLSDPELTEIIVNGTDPVRVEKRGRLVPTGISLTREEVLGLAKRLADRVNRQLNQEVPLQDARLRDGSRVAIAIAPAAVEGPYISIRRFLAESRSVKELIEWGAFSPEMAEFFRRAVEGRLNILVAGATGTGKSTLLDAVMTEYMPEWERVVVIEDNHELHLKERHQDTVYLEATAHDEDEKGVTLRDLLKHSLRLRPDRIVVGEVRGGEAAVMVQAMLSGHAGASTVHTRDPKWGTLLRLAEMVRQGAPGVPWEAILSQVREAVDLIVYLRRFPDGSRRVTEVVEVFPDRGQGEVFRDLFVYEDGEFKPVNPLSESRQKMIARNAWSPRAGGKLEENSVEKTPPPVLNLEGRKEANVNGIESGQTAVKGTPDGGRDAKINPKAERPAKRPAKKAVKKK